MSFKDKIIVDVWGHPEKNEEIKNKIISHIEDQLQKETEEANLTLQETIMKWISIEKELPNDNNNNGDLYNCVLVFSSINQSVAFAQYNGKNWNLLSDGVYSDVGNICIGLEYITHWMPLPNHPK